jgi:hypothetical protein
VRGEFDAGHARQQDVEHDKARTVTIEQRKRLLAGPGAAHAIFPSPLKRLLNERTELWLLVDDEHVPHGFAYKMPLFALLKHESALR